MNVMRNYFLANEDEVIHWSDYAWAAFGYGFPVVVSIYMFISIY